MHQLARTPEAQQLSQALVTHGKKMTTQRGVNNAELEHLYTRGKTHYALGNYNEALADFAYLTLHKPDEHRFHLMLGWALHRVQQHAHALKFFNYALLLNADDPTSSYGIASCLLALGEADNARAVLHIAIEQSYHHPRYHTIRTLSNELLDKISQH